jgi:ubiquinone/menaquinone biosynthesis C-methylase UbiE
LRRYWHPKTLIGLDLSERNIELATTLFQQQDVSFQQGDAEALPFDTGNFDIVLNIESSHLYPRPWKFFQEVYRDVDPLQRVFID